MGFITFASGGYIARLSVDLFLDIKLVFDAYDLLSVGSE